MPRFEPPDPDEIWLYGGVMAVLTAAGADCLGYYMEKDSLEYTDGSGSGWAFTWVGDDRAVISGRDVDFGTPVPEEALRAGAPDWAGAGSIEPQAGFFFWWDGARWDCAQGQQQGSPNGSGIMNYLYDYDVRLTDNFLTRIQVERAGLSPEEWGDESAFGDNLGLLMGAARKGRLTEDELAPVLSCLVLPGRRRLPDALAAAELAGFTPGSRHRLQH